MSFLSCGRRSGPVFRRCLSSSLNSSTDYYLVNSSIVFNRRISLASTCHQSAGIFQSLSQSSPVLETQHVLETVNSLTGLPWASTIVISTVALRLLVTFPLSAYQLFIIAKYENLKPEMDALVVELKKETAIAIRKFNWTEKQAKYAFNKSVRTQWNNLIVRDNCHIFKAYVGILVQMPVWIFATLALRNMVSGLPGGASSQLLCLALSTGGFAWFPDLTNMDHYFILPVVMMTTNLAINEMHALIRPASRFSSILTNIGRAISVAMLPIAAFQPSAIVLYWTVSSMCGLSQHLVLLAPSVRRKLGIPYHSKEIEKPYHQMLHNLKARFSKSSRPS